MINPGTRRLRKSLPSDAQTIQEDICIKKNIKKIGEISKHDNTTKQRDQNLEAIRPFKYYKTLRYFR